MTNPKTFSMPLPAGSFLLEQMRALYGNTTPGWTGQRTQTRECGDCGGTGRTGMREQCVVCKGMGRLG